METIMMWVEIVGIIFIPLVGWVINQTLIKQISDMNAATEKCNQRINIIEAGAQGKEDQTYRAINGQRSAFENLLRDYVRKDLYDQAIELHRINSDEKFKSLLSIVTTQYANLENKINESNKNTNEKISGLKDLINDKFNHQKGA